MSTAPSTPIDLQTLLASMDAVDAARTQEDLLNEAVSLDDRKAQLAAKLRATYAAQSITVSDEVIARGVEEHFAGRYAFQPLSKGLLWAAAMGWVKRGVIGFQVMMAGFALVALLGGYSLIKDGIQAYRADQAVKAVAAQKAAVAKAEAARLAAIAAEAKRAREAVAAEAARVAELKGLPERIKALGEAIHAVAKEGAVRDRAANLVQSGVGYAAAGDLPSARAAFRDLTNTLALLNLEYEVRVNLSGAKPGMSSEGRKWITGGYRVFKGSKRFYVVVNAVDGGTGRAVPVPVRSEEDGSIKTVSFWAEQISEATFDAIRAEKGRTGSLRDTLFALKTKGYLEPAYKQGLKAGGDQSTAGNHRITRW